MKSPKSTGLSSGSSRQRTRHRQRNPGNRVRPAAIQSFWRWFESVSDELSSHERRTATIRELDRRVRALGKFAWEIGPGSKEPHAFTISPGGDLERLRQTRTIVKQARKLAGWEFHAAKLPKDWSPVFDMGLGSAE